MVTAVNPRYSFARHETFHLRDGWLFKGLRAIEDNPLALSQPEAHHALGVGINMLRSMSHWIQATNLAEIAPEGGRPRPLRLTEVGELVRSYDPYLEDVGTLWIVHIGLSSNESLATFWYWVFNQFPQRDFGEERLLHGIQQFLLEREAQNVSPNSLKKDARCFIRTYISSGLGERSVSLEDALDCPLVNLGLLRSGAMPGQYRFQVGQHRSLPSLIFAYALYQYQQLTSPAEVVLSLEDLRWAPFSPGRLLCLDTASIIEYLEGLQIGTPYTRLTRTAGLNTVTLQRDVRPIDLLREYYGNYGGKNG